MSQAGLERLLVEPLFPNGFAQNFGEFPLAATLAADEDFWVTRPQAEWQTLRYFSPWDHEGVGGGFQVPPDEDFWVTRPQAEWQAFRPFPQWDREKVSGGLFVLAPPEEDFWPWQAKPSPAIATLGPLYRPDPEYLPAGSLSLQIPAGSGTLSDDYSGTLTDNYSGSLKTV